MNENWRSADLTCFGLAVALTAESGATQVLRYDAIRSALGLPGFASGDPLPVIEAPRVDKGVLHLRLGEEAHQLALTEQQPVRVFTNSSMVMTCNGPELGLIRDGAVVTRGDTVLWVGARSDLASSAIDLDGCERIDLGGRLITPGLVDSHAHPLFAGERADEFERRARGDHYLDIAREGGGIKATVEPTRAASIEEHMALCARRLSRALAWGTTTMEAKSGYDLRVDGELRLLQIGRMMDAVQPVSLSPTLLGAHVVPVEYEDDRAGYVAAVSEQMIVRAAQSGLADAVDVYCDEGAFTLEEMRTILEAGARHGLALKAHVGQFADLGGPQLLAELGARSGDHLEQVSAEGLAAMARAGVVATMLPGACIQLKMQPPPVEELRRAGVAMAIASDLNPGTSHSESLTVPMWLACTHYGMTVEEAWLGVTRIAAQALGRPSIGGIAIGMQADFAIWDAEIPAEVASHFAVNLVHQVYKAGRRVARPRT